MTVLSHVSPLRTTDEQLDNLLANKRNYDSRGDGGVGVQVAKLFNHLLPHTEINRYCDIGMGAGLSLAWMNSMRTIKHNIVVDIFRWGYETANLQTITSFFPKSTFEHYYSPYSANFAACDVCFYDIHEFVDYGLILDKCATHGRRKAR
jgi:hypothetical protein